MAYRDDDVDYDFHAAEYFSRVYDSPEERAERNRPKPQPVESSDDGYDAWRDEQYDRYDPRDYQWGSWDK